MWFSKTPKVLLLDDEPGVRYAFEELIAELGYEMAGLASSPEEAIEIFRKTPSDIALLDIHINTEEKGGIEVAQQIQKIRPTPIIYVTGYPERNFEQAKETFPANFLTKPIVRKEQLKHPIELALHNFWGANFSFPNLVGRYGWLYIRKSVEAGFSLKIHQTDVRYVKSSNNDIEIYHGKELSRTYVSSQKFSETLDKFPATRFEKINRTHFVNLEYISLKNNSEVMIEGTELLKISPSCKEKVLSKMR